MCVCEEEREEGGRVGVFFCGGFWVVLWFLGVLWFLVFLRFLGVSWFL